MPALGAVALIALLLPASVAAAAEQGDIERGADLWKQCSACHMVGPEAHSRIGPSLNEIFGRRAATVEDFRYSDAMRRAGADGLHWTADKLDNYIENPKTLVTGTRMNFRGLKEAADRRDLLAFLRQYSASPADIPESAPTATALPPDIDPAILAIVGDRDYGEYLSSECLTCHQASGADKGIPAITGWPTDDFVIAMQAYKTKKRPHPVMQMMAGSLSNEEIASLAAYFKELGTQ